MPALYTGTVDLVELYLATGLTVLLIGFAYVSGRILRIRAELSKMGRALIMDMLFENAIVQGKVVKVPRKEVLAMATGYVNAALPTVIPQVLEWAKANIKIGQTGVAGPGGIGMDPLLQMIPKEYRGLAGIAMRLFGGKLGLGTGSSAGASTTEGGLRKTL